MRRRLARDSRILPQHYGLALSVSFSFFLPLFPSLFLFLPLPGYISSLTDDPTVSVFVYLSLVYTTTKPG